MADSLEQALKSIFLRKSGKILIVDDRCDSSSPIYNPDHIGLEDEILDFARKHGTDMTIIDVGHKSIYEDHHTQELARGADVALVISSERGIYGLKIVDMFNIRIECESIKELCPDAPIIQYLPKMPGDCASNALTQVMQLMDPAFDLLSYRQIDLKDNPTLVSMIHRMIFEASDNEKFSLRTKHELENSLWDDYLPYIDESLRAGNNQTSLGYHFLILSDREYSLMAGEPVNAKEKVKVQQLNYHLDAEDLSRCKAIFIDNAWNPFVHETALGEGIGALRRIREMMDKEGVDIPIVYQSGHPLSCFSEQEIQEVQSLGAVLAAKDIFPKVYKGHRLAKKDLAIAKAVSDPSLELLAGHLATPVMALEGDDFTVVCTRMAVDKGSSAPYERMHVLAMFHTYLKHEMDNPDLQETSVDFYSFDEIRSRLEENGYDVRELDSLKDVYENIVERHRSYAPVVLTHNDSKWDNWFKGCILGDFGSVQPGTEFKDIAKSMLDMNPRDISESVIDKYIAHRKSIDPSFDVDKDEFALNVYEMIITESLRTAYYKASDRETADDLVKIALEYSDLVRDMDPSFK